MSIYHDSFTLKGGNDMDHHIVEKPGFSIAARTRRFTTVNEQNYLEVPKFWEEFLKSSECGELTALSQNKPGAVTGGMMLGIFSYEDKTTDVSYAIGVELPEGITTSTFETINISSAIWAVFNCTPPTIKDVVTQIYREWLPSTNHQQDAKPGLEIYLPGDETSMEMRCQLWIPIISRKL